MMKRSLVTASLALLLGCALLGHASASTTTITGNTNPIVAWSQSVSGTLTLIPNYTALGVTNGSGFGTIIPATNAGYSGNANQSCTPSVAQTGNVINYGLVYLPLGANYTVCDYKNALLTEVVTNDTTGWNVTQQLALAPSNGFRLCSIANGGGLTTVIPLTLSTQTSASAAINEQNCTGAQQTLGADNTTPALNTLIPTQSGAGASGTFYSGEDVLLIVEPVGVTTTTYSVTMNVTLTLN
jgi:hypothetical protein